jgi:hypothetical protein
MSTNVQQRNDAWPSLPLADWQDTYATLHRWTQIVGKTRLALSPMENHYWQVCLYPSARGLTTSPIPYSNLSFDVEFDFIDHALIARTSEGDTRSLPLVPQSVADFYREYSALLGDLGIDTRISPIASELADATPLDEDRKHASYDADAAHRCWTILTQADSVLKEFRSGFIGKCSPSHFWWGGFDLACTRFSGQIAPPHPGGIPHLPDYVTREAYSHECISAGWWPGTPGSPIEEPSFYAYAYPEPTNYPQASVLPGTCRYDNTMREWVLPYEVMRTAEDPNAVLLNFLQESYDAAADLGGWDRAALERR